MPRVVLQFLSATRLSRTAAPAARYGIRATFSGAAARLSEHDVEAVLTRWGDAPATASGRFMREKHRYKITATYVQIEGRWLLPQGDGHRNPCERKPVLAPLLVRAKCTARLTWRQA